jgi:hypothetical protein
MPNNNGPFEPATFTQDEIDAGKADIRVPMIGKRLPYGWERVDINEWDDEDDHGIYGGDNEGCGAYFVDSSGFGELIEAALTIDQFVDVLKPHDDNGIELGYGVVEVGQFQVKVGVFRKVD